MKRMLRLIRWVLVSAAMLAIPSGCVVDGRIHGGVGIYYGPVRFWFYDGPWLDGRTWWREGITIHPPPIYIGGRHSGPRIPHRPR